MLRFGLGFDNVDNQLFGTLEQDHLEYGADVKYILYTA